MGIIWIFLNLYISGIQCFYEDISAISLARKLRHGPAPKTFHCNLIRGISSEMRKNFKLPNDEVSKYTEVFGIPIVGTEAVIDDALKRACYVTAFILAHRSDIRDVYYEGKGVVHIMASKEKPSRPPARCKITGWWRGSDNQRGLPPSEKHPYVVGAEENVLCPHKWKLIDPYRQEDMLLHQFAHAVLAILFVKDEKFKNKILEAYQKAKKARKWRHLYAIKNVHEYFAEGSQSFFNVNVEGGKRVHGPVNTRHELKRYDPDLYYLVSEAFPCSDDFIKKCEVSASKASQAVLDLDMDCHKKILKAEKCKDHNIWCTKWAQEGECKSNPAYMKTKCRAACRSCRKASSSVCYDHHGDCEAWAILGECDKNPGFMQVHCMLSCKKCPKEEEDESCFDVGPQCPGWKIMGQCKKSRAYMERFCRRSCNFCKNPVIFV